MTEHSVEELRRQYQAASDRTRAAQQAEREACERWKQAKVGATGLLGHVVEGPQWKGHSKSHRIVVDAIGHWSDDKVMGRIIKKDGTPGERTAEVLISEAKDLGLLAESSK